MELREGIIVKTINYKENSRIVYLITNEGLETVEVKAANKINGHTQLYSKLLTKIEFSTKGHFFSSGKVINNYPNIKCDFNRLDSVLQILEMSYTLVEHINDFNTFYNFLSDILELIENEEDYKLYELIFYIKNLYLLGIAPTLNKCVECGSKEDLLGFVFTSGGMICKNCYHANESFYDEKVIITIIKMYFTKLENIKDTLIEYNYNDVKTFIDRYYKEYLGYTSKSQKILDKIKD